MVGRQNVFVAIDYHTKYLVTFTSSHLRVACFVGEWFSSRGTQQLPISRHGGFSEHPKTTAHQTSSFQRLVNSTLRRILNDAGLKGSRLPDDTGEYPQSGSDSTDFDNPEVSAAHINCKIQAVPPRHLTSPNLIRGVASIDTTNIAIIATPLRPELCTPSLAWCLEPHGSFPSYD